MAPVQVQPSSGPEQSELHFLRSTIGIPSSQASRPARIPSQHVVSQIEGFDESPPKQFQPGTFPEQSYLHFEVPSMSPSSHISGETTLESPQFAF